MDDMPATKLVKPGGHIAAIDNFRGLCILGMIIIHGAAWFHLSSVGFYLSHSLPFVLPGFMLLIGLMMGYHYMPRLTSKSARIKIQRRLFWRAIKIMLYAYVFSIFFYLIFRQPSGYNSCIPDAQRSIKAILDLVTLQRINHRMAVLILISFLLLLSQIIIWTHKYSRRWYVMIASGLALYLSFLAIGGPFPDPPHTLGRLPIFLSLEWKFPFLAWSSFLFFGVAIGSLAYKYIKSGKLVKLYSGMILLGTLGILIWLALAYFMYKTSDKYIFPRELSAPPTPYYVVYCLSLCLLIMGLFLFLGERKIKIPGEHLLSVFGKHSLFCFIYHWCVLHVVYIILKRTKAPLSVRWFALAGLVFVVYISAILQARFLARRKAAKLKAKASAD